jgi:hypothetical protein
MLKQVAENAHNYNILRMILVIWNSNCLFFFFNWRVLSLALFMFKNDVRKKFNSICPYKISLFRHIF